MTTGDGHKVRVAIVGAGFGGLGMAIRLKQSGIEDFVVFERDADVGGTWWANTYPGCQCDIPSHLYSYSFAPNSEWSRTYPLQPEIREYLRDCADRFGLRAHIRFECPVRARRMGRRRGRMADRHARRPVLGADADRRPGAAQRALDPGASGEGGLPGRRLPHRSLGSLAGSDRSQRRGHRHGRVGDPDRPPDPAARESADDLPAHARRGSSPIATVRSRSSSAGCTGGCRRRSGPCARWCTSAASCSCRDWCSGRS